MLVVAAFVGACRGFSAFITIILGRLNGAAYGDVLTTGLVYMSHWRKRACFQRDDFMTVIYRILGRGIEVS
jgi:hypothetical protein